VGQNKTAELGRQGEELAKLFLEGQGLVVLSRNWRCRDGELDIVATDGIRLIVCEVKTRSGTAFGTPREAVTLAKQTRIRKLTNLWLSAYKVGWCETRFDIVSVVWPGHGPARVEHLRGAF
jgi:putative endonuclease